MTINTDGGAYISGIVNAPTFIGRDQFNYYFSGLAPLVHDPIRRFRNFLNEYLGTPDHSVPFGGRQTQIEELDNWFNDPSTPPYYLMVAEAGRGKSALVCRWIEQLRQQRNDVEVVFIPISIRFETATQDVVFAALAARLAKLHNEPLNPVALSGKQWQGVCESYVDRSLLDALSAALGPLTLDDLAELAPEFQSSRLVRTLLKFVERWVIGNGKEQGYVFSHSRLGYYFWEQLNHQEQVDWDRRLCDWGAYTLEKLNTDQLDPKDTSVYLLRYYVAHLQRSNAPTEAFYALVSNGWRKAWECLDISYSGFFNDLEQAWSAAVLEGISALGQLIRTALFMSSAITVNTNMRDDLLVSCLDAKVITPTNALALARCKTDINERIATLLAVSKHLPVDLQKTALVEALTNIREIADKDNRLDELAKLAAHLTSDVSDVAEKVWMILNEDSFPRAMMLGEWARKLPPDQQRPIFIEALNTVSTINNKGEYFAALLYIARCITPVTNDFSEKILAMAQTIYQKSNDSRTYVEVLCVVADEVNADRKFGILQSALEIARAVAFEGIRISSLGIISSRLPAWQQVSVLQEMLVVARSIPNEFIRAEELTVIATYTPPQLAEIINLILTEAHNIANETIRFKVLTHIVWTFEKRVKRTSQKLTKKRN